MGKNRLFKIEISVEDNEATEATNEQSAEALKDYMLDVLGDLAFDVKDIKVSCE